MKKYKATFSLYGKMIEPVEVDKETSKSVWIEGRRLAKRSSYENYLDSFEEAKECLMEYADELSVDARRRLQYARDVRGKVKGLKAEEG